MWLLYEKRKYMNDRENFNAMTLVQKINAIDKVIQDNIRDLLIRDDGDLELINVEEKNEFIIVYVEYQGACVSCASAPGTHAQVERILQRMLSENILVRSI